MYYSENLVDELRSYLKLPVPVKYFAAFDAERDGIYAIMDFIETNNIHCLKLDDHCYIPCFQKEEDLLCFVLKYKDIETVSIHDVIYLITKIKLIDDEYSIEQMEYFGPEMKSIAINTFREFGEFKLVNESIEKGYEDQ